MKKIATIIFTLVVVIGSIGYLYENPLTAEAGPGAITLTASSSAITLTTTSKQLLATSTRRTAFSIQPMYCTVGGTVFVNMAGRDVAATTLTGFGVRASTTESFDDNNIAAETTAIRGVLDSGTCTVLVTEWHNNF